jgi:hypothetical protein
VSENGRVVYASGRQLWRLNVEGLLQTALTRSHPYPITKATAWELLADSSRERSRCPGECRWPRSCALRGCWLAERRDAAAAYIEAPNP